MQLSKVLTTIALLIGLGLLGTVVAQPQSPVTEPVELTADEQTVPSNLSFEQQVRKHLVIYTRTDARRRWAETERSQVLAREGSAREYARFNDLYEASIRTLSPYLRVADQAQAIRADGFGINLSTGQVCKGADCRAVDPVLGTVVFLFQASEQRRVATVPRQQASNPPPSTRTCGNGQIPTRVGDLCVILDMLSDKPLDTLTFGILPGIRNFIIPASENGDLANFIRDPGNRTADFLREGRDRVLPPDSSNDAVRWLRDPGRETARFFGFR